MAIEAKELSVVNLFSTSGLHATILLWHYMPFEDNSLLFSRLRIEYKCSVQVYICKKIIQNALMCIMCSGLMQVYVEGLVGLMIFLASESEVIGSLILGCLVSP